MTTARDVIRLARSQLGYREGHNAQGWDNQEKYAAQVPGLGWANGQPWCCTFVMWLLFKAGGAKLLPNGQATASVATARDWWKALGRFSEYPALGAQAIFGVRGDEHTGIVVGYTDTTVTTIEGNTNKTGGAEGYQVAKQTRRRADPFVYGYGYPAYDVIVSADPKWQPSYRGGNVTKAAKLTRRARRHAHNPRRRRLLGNVLDTFAKLGRRHRKAGK